MNFLTAEGEAKIMKEILKDDKKLMQDIQDSMFVFETLMLSDDKSLQTLLRAVEDELIVLALKGAPEELRTKLFGLYVTACSSKHSRRNGSSWTCKIDRSSRSTNK